MTAAQKARADRLSQRKHRASKTSPVTDLEDALIVLAWEAGELTDRRDHLDAPGLQEEAEAVTEAARLVGDDHAQDLGGGSRGPATLAHGGTGLSRLLLEPGEPRWLRRPLTWVAAPAGCLSGAHLRISTTLPLPVGLPVFGSIGAIVPAYRCPALYSTDRAPGSVRYGRGLPWDTVETRPANSSVT